MHPVHVLVLHRPATPGDGPLARLLAGVRAGLAEGQRHGFLAAGADEARVVTWPADGTPFGTRLRALAADLPGDDGLVVLGSGSLPLARPTDRRRYVEAARGPRGTALVNNRYSADAMAISGLDRLADLPPLPADNALPRWLAEVAGWAVADLRGTTRLQLDLDTPLDLVLLAGLPGALPIIRDAAAGLPGPVPERLAALRAVLADPRAEVVVAGRTSSGTLAALERGAACRVRALVEERGLRASSRLALGEDGGARSNFHGSGDQRPPRSVLGLLLDRDGPAALGPLLGELGEAAVVDTRILLAHRLGPDARAWPAAEDRFASDLLLPERVTNPWLRTLTGSATEAPIPVLLGGHTLVGPGLRALVATRRAAGPRP